MNYVLILSLLLLSACGNIIEGKCSDLPERQKTSCVNSLSLEELSQEMELD